MRAINAQRRQRFPKLGSKSERAGGTWLVIPVPYLYASSSSQRRSRVALCFALRNATQAPRPVPGMLLLTFGCTWHLPEWNFACVSGLPLGEPGSRRSQSTSPLSWVTRKIWLREYAVPSFLPSFFFFFAFLHSFPYVTTLAYASSTSFKS